MEVWMREGLTGWILAVGLLAAGCGGGGTASPAASPAARCGDGRLAAGEACDDGNATSGDGCSATCTVEAGFTCSGTPSVCAAAAVCGDGRLAAGEACDDGNTTSGDGCSATCTVEGGFTCAGTPSVCAAFAWDVALWDQGTWQ
jgi:cysteine-rich repeat protein